MQLASKEVGRRYLETRSALAKRLAELKPFRSFLIVDDKQFDADVLAGLLRKITGEDTQVSTARTPANAVTLVTRQAPDLLFMDDRLGHNGTALTLLPALRRVGFLGPVVILSNLMTRERRAEFIRLGAAEALHKDDLDSGALISLLLKIAGAGDTRAGA